MAVPTTIDTFRFILKASDVLSSYQRNLRQNVVQIQGLFHGTVTTTPPSPLLNNLPATQAAVRTFGLAVLQAIAPLSAAFTSFPTQITAAAVAPLPLLTDLQAAYNLIFTWATNMNTAVFNTSADLDNGVASLLAAVPDTILPY
jgi:hypothetical protein